MATSTRGDESMAEIQAQKGPDTSCISCFGGGWERGRARANEVSKLFGA